MPGKPDLQKVVARYGADAKATLANPAVSGEPEDQLRTPLVRLFKYLAELCSLKADWLAAVGESEFSALETQLRCETCWLASSRSMHRINGLIAKAISTMR